MNNTKRELIIAHVMAELRAIATVGAVADAGVLTDSVIGEHFASGKFALEVVSMDDEKTGEEVNQFETFHFALAVIAYLPLKLADAVERTPSSLAANIHGEVYTKLASPVGDAYTLGGHAINCELQGGGAAGINRDLNCSEGMSSFKVTYRHAVGDPTA